MKQTAVEWLVQELSKQNMYMHLFKKEIAVAKEMEKKQIMAAWDNGFDEINRASRTSQNYYNETFKSEENGQKNN